jgi:hypothetical protein
LTVNVWKAIVRVADRAAPVFASTTNATEPLPEPWLPAVMVTHGTPLVAVQAQPFLAATETLPVPPATPNVWLDGEME